MTRSVPFGPLRFDLLQSDLKLWSHNALTPTPAEGTVAPQARPVGSL